MLNLLVHETSRLQKVKGQTHRQNRGNDIGHKFCQVCTALMTGKTPPFTCVRQTGCKRCTYFFLNENVPSLKSQQAQFVFCKSALARNVRLQHKDTSALLGGSGRENIFRNQACYLLLFIKVPFSTKERWCTTLFLPYA